MNSNAVRFTGQEGELRWSYHRAAVLSSWSISAEPTSGLRLTATVVNMDAFRVSQRPLTFQVPRPSGQAWTWSLQTLQITGSNLVALLEES